MTPEVRAILSDPEKLRRALAEVDGNKTKLAIQLGCNEKTVRNWCRRHEKRKAVPDITPEKIISDATEAVKERAKERLLAELMQERVKTDILAEKIVGAVAAVPANPNIEPPPPSKGPFDPEEAVLLVSDVQGGQVTTLEETGGLGEYNLEIFHERLKQLERSVSRITQIHRMAYEIPKLNMWFLGDIVENETIYQGQAHEIEQCVINQMFTMADAFVAFIIRLLAVFPRVEVHAVAGNHGRIGKKGEAKHYVNWDYLLYKFMEARTAEYRDRLTWYIPKAWFDLVDVQGWNFLLLHGEDIKSWNSIPYYGIDRADARWTKLLQRRGEMYHYLVMGHFHSQAQLDNVLGEKIVNGAWPGMSMFSLKKLQIANRPSQLFFGVHPNKGKTWTYKLSLD